MTTAISIDADRNYVAAIGILAHRRKTTMAALVRNALDTEHGEEVKEILEHLFFASDVASTQLNSDNAPEANLEPQP